ncbi:MAG: FAD-dependent oxidoreductase, partial [Chloroflexi bacterium]
MSITTVVAEAAVEELKKQVRGELIRTGEPSYESARKVWNGMIDRRPAVIVRCSGVADVIDAVNFARDNDLPLAVRGGSHSAAGLAMCDDGLVIDLSAMRGVRVDPRAR